MNSLSLSIMAIVPIIWKTDDSKSRHFAQISYGFWQNGAHLSGLKMVRLPEHRSHSKSGPIATQPLFDHTKSRLVQDFRSPLYFNNSYNENGQNPFKKGFFVDHCTLYSGDSHYPVGNGVIEVVWPQVVLKNTI